MKKFEAKTLEEVYEIASNEFNCSIIDLEIVITQQPSKGFLGIGKKTAIITAQLKRKQKKDNRKYKETKYRKNNINIEDLSEKIANSNTNEIKTERIPTSKVPNVEGKEQIFNNFYTEVNQKDEISKIVIKKDKEEIILEVKKDVNTLFQNTCYEIDEIEVDFYDEETLYIEFNGKDSALLIGKEGYRYKALSYILFNWINEKYGLMLRLEVAEFLKNQEEAIYNYLSPVIETIKETGTYKTKPLDGILVHIALKRLREEFPNKYVAVKTNVRGDKYVLVNEYRSNQ
ncbi:Jag N-terminal domain-containing protein [Arcobacter sp.]|uniref:Jag N-terminal domain-containing protein n=1 Tax=unclassified Arcobacter TaxID=2593671 RepID=UPI003AFFB3BB|eukprot:TRINITY_DN1800_c0_g2_i2.p3 TRINITY_DN1800_c0_g2~~TRINITY_DN1800_c0_g2_i2.p3  ORF type:complete len:287 (+),score=-57.23 TRINITY_DN1800_c0_g2_i2:1811-2671(+)